MFPLPDGLPPACFLYLDVSVSPSPTNCSGKTPSNTSLMLLSTVVTFFCISGRQSLLQVRDYPQGFISMNKKSPVKEHFNGEQRISFFILYILKDTGPIVLDVLKIFFLPTVHLLPSFDSVLPSIFLMLQFNLMKDSKYLSQGEREQTSNLKIFEIYFDALSKQILYVHIYI